jgi:hypothetical protein
MAVAAHVSTLLDRLLMLPSVAYKDRRTALPETPGLYFAIRGREVLYIGMSRKSIRSRWQAVAQAGQAQIERRGLQDEVRIAYIIYRDPEAVVDDEKQAIRTFRPTFNFNHVPGALERVHQRNAEECDRLDCRWHDHDRWPRKQAPRPPADR